MVDEMNDFADVFENPDDQDQLARYNKWFDEARVVNSVMFDLRQSADLMFPADRNR